LIANALRVGPESVDPLWADPTGFTGTPAHDWIWDTPTSDLASRDFELVAKRTGAGELDADLRRIAAADASTQLVPLKQIADVTRGCSYDRSTTTNVNDGTGVGLIRVGDLGSLGLRPASLRLTRDAAERLKPTQRLRSGDVALTLSGTVGKVALVEEATGAVGAAAAKSLAVIRTKAELQGPFLAALLGSPAYFAWLVGHARGATIQHLSVRTLGTLPIPVVPLAIQDAVLRQLEPGGDALQLLARLLAGGSSDPVVTWLERPIVAAMLSGKLDAEPAKKLSAVGEALRELQWLRNQSVHLRVELAEPVRRWLVASVELGAVLTGVDRIPKGTPRIAALELAGRRCEMATAALEVEGSGQAPARARTASGVVVNGATQSGTSPIVARLRALMAALERLLEAARAEILSPVRLSLSADPRTVAVGVPTEVRLVVTNPASLGLRSVAVTTEPDVGRSC
jgi:hypothetical protein